MSSPLTRYTGFAHARYDIAENVRVFAQGTFVTSDVAQLQLPFNAPQVAHAPIGVETVRVRSTWRSCWTRAPNPNADWRFNRLSSGYYGNRSNTNQTKLLEFVVGLEGEIASDWSYEAYTTYGETVLLTNLDHQMWTERYRGCRDEAGVW